jgi:hypothetical protein
MSARHPHFEGVGLARRDDEVIILIGWEHMATIIAVHGTFSSGAETGSKWWQKGSPFEAELRNLVEGTDGQLDFVPHLWDGLNSET